VVSPDTEAVGTVVVEIEYLHVNEEAQAEKNATYAHGVGTLRGPAPLRERHKTWHRHSA
jgi:hypothetical protein